ncbi:hypothetical protein EMPS_08805 [Entomortierella parvispora]|uniref:Major facilitator superfamily (MFS) profile domain-containing protein n=1 Tax=Entomortierella parvispora TaxID=205924 RepID=A0A9P3HH11_9FUNG|nr:hypothetical protein EMPS_08805 [Entomortierella parvispora]
MLPSESHGNASLPSPSGLIGIPRRFWILFMGGLGLMISYADRSNMAVAIVAIAREYNYNKSEQGLILAAFFIGYILTPILGGSLADKHGGKMVLATGALIWTLFTALTSLAAGWGLVWMVLVRIGLGLGEGVAYPSVHALIGAWIPPCERSKAVAMITAFSYLGAVIALPTSSALVVSSWGWRSIFWLFGAMGLSWSAIWQIWGSSSPKTCKRLLLRERRWILQQQRLEQEANGHSRRSEELEERGESSEDEEEGGTAPSFIPDSNTIAYQPVRSSEERLTQNPARLDLTILATAPSSTSLADVHKPATPWKALLLRREVWAIIISQFCNSLGFFVMQSWLPTFYLDYYGVDVGKIGYFSVVPSIAQGTMGFVAGFLGDKAVKDWGWQTLTVRRVSQALGSVGLGVFLLLAVKLAKDATTAMIIITVGMAINGFTMIGASAYQHDFCPQHAGFIFSLGNTAGTIPGLVGVFLVGFLLDKNRNEKGGDTVGGMDDKARWNLIWTFVCFFYLFGSSVFVILSTNKKFPRTI